MKRACRKPDCYVEDTGCVMGHMTPQECSFFVLAEGEVSEANPADAFALPWTGRVFGLSDLHFVAARKKPRTIGVIGPQNAGKTTLLSILYLMLSRGEKALPNACFAGSYTLEGWETVAGPLRFSPGQPITFPPHTTSRSDRSPGLLHLSCRPRDQTTQDFLLADAPGEWFQKWAINRDAENAAGARWIAQYADCFLIIADRAALSGPKKGAARSDLQLLAQRLGSETSSRPVALVWTKADVEIDEAMEDSVRSAVKASCPSAVEFSVAVLPTESDVDGGMETDVAALLRLFNWMLSLDTPRRSLYPERAAAKQDPFMAYGTLR